MSEMLPSTCKYRSRQICRYLWCSRRTLPCNFGRVHVISWLVAVLPSGCLEWLCLYIEPRALTVPMWTSRHLIIKLVFRAVVIQGQKIGGAAEQ